MAMPTEQICTKCRRVFKGSDFVPMMPVCPECEIGELEDDSKKFISRALNKMLNQDETTGNDAFPKGGE